MQKYIKPLKIGSVELENNIITAPMAGVTNYPFRKILDRYMPGLMFCEMISTNAIFYNDNKTRTLLDKDGIKSEVGFQMFGSDLESIEYTTKFLCDNYDVKIIDFNMGCPAPKVVKNGAGSNLLNNLDLVKKILKVIAKNSRVPVTLKYRLGYDRNNYVGDKVALLAQDAGFSALTIHGRYRSDFFQGNSDIEKIKEIKQIVDIPIIGNGDITDYEMAKKYFEYAKVDGIMLARGLFGKPWLIDIIKKEDRNENFEIKSEEKKQIILDHLKFAYEEKGLTGLKEFRKHLAMYSKNENNSSSFRSKVLTIDDYDLLKDEINNFF